MVVSLTIDHLVISAETLCAGIEYVQDLLGVTVAPGGKHPSMGTHNALLGLGEFYLEVLAIDPDAVQPDCARMFDIDNFRGPPRLTNWVARTNDLDAAMAFVPLNMGQIKPVSRGALTWRMVVPADGRLPFDGAYPSLIQWDGSAHPTQSLPDVGCALDMFQITTPDAAAMQESFARFDSPLGNVAHPGDTLRFKAQISTPNGVKTLT